MEFRSDEGQIGKEEPETDRKQRKGLGPEANKPMILPHRQKEDTNLNMGGSQADVNPLKMAVNVVKDFTNIKGGPN